MVEVAYTRQKGENVQSVEIGPRIRVIVAHKQHCLRHGQARHKKLT